MMVETDNAWPREHLEVVPECPVCGGAKRSLEHPALTDTSFGAAPGEWDLWRCAVCSTGWLDPRPDIASIGMAYANYYTHDDANYFPPGNGDLRNRLGNGYRNWRFGLSQHPASRIGILAAILSAKTRRRLDQQMRYLPRASDAASSAILDIGCGNGAFLAVAREAGWSCAGVEPDPDARMSAERRGLDVRASLDDFVCHQRHFGYATLSHVIEHVHHPLETLRQVRHLLCDGGGLFIATPNMDAVGHEIYGRYWRGLEAPRHLVLFSKASLTRALEEAGFSGIEFHSVPGIFQAMMPQNRRAEAGHLSEDAAAPMAPERPVNAAQVDASETGDKAEFLIVTAVRQ